MIARAWKRIWGWWAAYRRAVKAPSTPEDDSWDQW